MSQHHDFRIYNFQSCNPPDQPEQLPQQLQQLYPLHQQTVPSSAEPETSTSHLHTNNFQHFQQISMDSSPTYLTSHSLTTTMTTILQNFSNRDFNSNNITCTTSDHNTADTSSRTAIWRPSPRLRNIHTRFDKTVLFQHPCIPCAYCAHLLYPSKAKWIPHDESVTYPLETNFQGTAPYIITKDTGHTVAVCTTCKNC